MHHKFRAQALARLARFAPHLLLAVSCSRPLAHTPSPTAPSPPPSILSIPAPSSAQDAGAAAANIHNGDEDPKTLLERLQPGHAQHTETAVAAPWKYRANTTVLTWVETGDAAGGSNPEDADDHLLNVILIDTSTATLRLVAKSKPISVELSPEEKICAECEAQPLDFAPYAIRDTEMAFGVRIFRAQRSGESSENSETLYLFRLNAEALDEILEVETLRDEVVSREHSESKETRRVVVMQKKAHGGFFDLALRTVSDKSEPTVHFFWNTKTGAYEQQQ